MFQREIWSLLTGAVETIFHGQSLITGNIARKNDKNKSISFKLKCFLIAGAHNLKLTCSATHCNMTTNTPWFSRFPIDFTWQPVSAWHHASFWNRKRRWRHRSVRIVNWRLSFKLSHLCCVFYWRRFQTVSFKLQMWNMLFSKGGFGQCNVYIHYIYIIYIVFGWVMLLGSLQIVASSGILWIADLYLYNLVPRSTLVITCRAFQEF